MEPLVAKLQLNSQIQGIKIPNGCQEIKTIQHVDGMAVMKTTEMSYRVLNKETKDFGSVSRSKINVAKTEILCYGNSKAIPKKYIKDTIKVPYVSLLHKR